MEKTTISFNFLEKIYYGEVEYFQPPTVMPYYKVSLTDANLIDEFGMIHNFKEVVKNHFITLEPALDPQGKYHAYLWTCLMAAIYILLLNDQTK